MFSMIITFLTSITIILSSLFLDPERNPHKFQIFEEQLDKPQNAPQGG